MHTGRSEAPDAGPIRAPHGIVSSANLIFVKLRRDSSSSQIVSSATADLPQPELLAAIPRLRRYARVLIGNPTRADDLVRDTLVRAWAKRRLWRAGSDLRAWLFAVMHNVYVNQRILARHEAGNVSLDAGHVDGEALQLGQPGNQQQRVEVREIVQLMERPPVAQREVLALAALEEMRYDEIAVALAVPVGTVMSRLSRARETLRRFATERPAARGQPTAAARASRRWVAANLLQTGLPRRRANARGSRDPDNAQPARVMTTSRYSLGSTSDSSPERLPASMSARRSRVNAACCSASSAPNVLFMGP
jgi:RNA polymerase sigma-70 factor (ECF subfamily)